VCFCSLTGICIIAVNIACGHWRCLGQVISNATTLTSCASACPRWRRVAAMRARSIWSNKAIAGGTQVPVDESSVRVAQRHAVSVRQRAEGTYRWRQEHVPEVWWARATTLAPPYCLEATKTCHVCCRVVVHVVDSSLHTSLNRNHAYLLQPTAVELELALLSIQFYRGAYVRPLCAYVRH